MCGVGDPTARHLLLPDVQPGDPLTLAAVAAVLVLAAVAASLAPVRDAFRVEPMVALRED